MNPTSRTWTARFGRAFALDLRSLAGLRFALGVLLALDVLARLADLSAFYGDGGVLPRAIQVQTVAVWRWSLHLANGAPLFALALLLVQAAAALAFAAGWRTRTAGLVAWLLTVSLANRNPLVLTAADSLFCVLLFWSLFLPMAARWSVDAALAPAAPAAGLDDAPREDHRHASWASVALLLQVLAVFFFQALLTPAAAAPTGDAGLLAAGRWLHAHAALAAAIAGWALWAGLLAPPLMLVGRAGGGRGITALRILRALMLTQMLLLSLLDALTLDVGLAPWLQSAGLFALLGSGFWDWLGQRRGSRASAGELRLYYDADNPRAQRASHMLTMLLILSDARIAPAQAHRRAASLLRAGDAWVVIDRDDAAHLKGTALLVLLRRSPLLGWLARLAGGALLAPAERLHARVALGTATFGRPAAASATPSTPSTGLQRFAGVAATLVLVWNLAGLQRGAGPLQSLLAPPLEALRLDQHWDRHWPAPPPVDASWVAAGHLADGREVDALRPGAALRYDTHRAPRDGGLRWQAWQAQVAGSGGAAPRARWMHWLCERWNAGRSAESADLLVDFRLVQMLDRRPGDARELEQRVLGRQDCVAAR